MHNLSIAISNLRMILDCNIVLDGYIGSHIDKHIDKLKELVANRNPFEHEADYLDVCTYKFEATAVGYALHYIGKFFADI